MPPTEVETSPASTARSAPTASVSVGSLGGELADERRVGALPMRAPGVERHVHGRRRALAAQGRGGRLERLAQLPRQGALGVGDAA